MLYALIMAGGSGTRFWPASRRGRPKQLLSLIGDSSMLQASVARLTGLVPPENTLVLTNQRLVEATHQQLPSLPESAIIGEPCKRDTAPCIGLAAGLIARRDPDASMLVTPADHVIRRVDRFHAAVRDGQRLLDEDPARIVTFGIRPAYPAQVFGYIERGRPVGTAAWSVTRFREKPDLETARQFVESGQFYWNSGIFLWRCQTILDALGQFQPAMMEHINRIVSVAGSPAFDPCFEKEFSEIRGQSIDFAVMEHYENVCVIEAPFDWDDVGNWAAIPRLTGTDASGNSASGKQLLIDCRGCIVRSTNDHLVVGLGLQDCVVIHTADATLVADARDETAIRQVVQELESRQWDAYL